MEQEPFYEMKIKKSSLDSSRQPPVKSASVISAISVYDMYGLEVACEFIRHIYFYKNDFNHPEWLETYLLGSLSIIWPDVLKTPVEKSIIYFSTALILHLIQLDSLQLKMIGTLEPSGYNLPLELLARITESRMLSEPIRREVSTMWESKIP